MDRILMEYCAETGKWVAQCLSIDIAAQGETIVSAYHNLVATVGAEMDARACTVSELAHEIGPAPFDVVARV